VTLVELPALVLAASAGEKFRRSLARAEHSGLFDAGTPEVAGWR
jgi:hypothetical protein